MIIINDKIFDTRYMGKYTYEEVRLDMDSPIRKTYNISLPLLYNISFDHCPSIYIDNDVDSIYQEAHVVALNDVFYYLYQYSPYESSSSRSIYYGYVLELNT